MWDMPGVISDIPNVYERLKQEGIEFQTVTAGKYKHTLTPTKKVTKEDLAKSKEDIEDILSLFKGFVKENRPQLDIDSVATGETWFGTDALSKGLCDEIGTADDVLLSYIDQGYDVYDVKYEPEPELTAKSLLSLPVGKRGDRGENVGLGRSLIRSLVRTFADEVVSTMKDVTNERMMGGVGGAEKRYMMKDPSDVANRIRMED
uniref:Peptidase S49 domain-containing protein n=1 Tax=Ditylum brightwellii TaxID=49249 RepID=A0A7S4S8J9_9STRA